MKNKSLFLACLLMSKVCAGTSNIYWWETTSSDFSMYDYKELPKKALEFATKYGWLTLNGDKMQGITISAYGKLLEGKTLAPTPYIYEVSMARNKSIDYNSYSVAGHADRPQQVLDLNKLETLLFN